MLAVAAIALTSVLVGPTAAHAAEGTSLTFGTWVPGIGSCHQVVTASLEPSQTQAGAAPTGTVRIVSESGQTLGSTSVTGYGTFTVTGTCFADADRHAISLVYDGDATHAPTQVDSPDACPRDPELLTAFVYHQLSRDQGEPKPVFVCNRGNGFSTRAVDGRAYPATGHAHLSGTAAYGEAIDPSVWVKAPPTVGSLDGAITATIDGRLVEKHKASSGRWLDLHLSTASLTPGRYQLKVSYSGDELVAPSVLYRDTIRVVKASPLGSYRVARWRLSIGDQPRLTIRYRNPFSKTAATPTGRVDIYLGKQRLKSVHLHAADKGRLSTVLPRVRHQGSYLLRTVFRGDSRYQTLDSAGPGWQSSQQYIQVSR